MPTDTSYEFDAQQNAAFAKLAGAMTFCAIALVIPATLLGLAAFEFESTWSGRAVYLILAVLLIAIGLLQLGAGRRFKRIVTTTGHDVDNLMTAVGGLVAAYETQRWLWIVVGFVVAVALFETLKGY